MPVRHYHTWWTVRGAYTATISNKELITRVKPSSIGIVTMITRLRVTVANVVAIWHYASFLTILFNKFEQIWASGIHKVLFNLRCIIFLAIITTIFIISPVLSSIRPLISTILFSVRSFITTVFTAVQPFIFAILFSPRLLIPTVLVSFHSFIFAVLSTI